MSFKTAIKIPVRFADVDFMGHVNNAKVITYMEEGRVAYFRQIPELNFLGRSGVPEQSLIIAEISCQFKSPVVLGEVVEVALGVTTTGRTSFVMEYELVEGTSRRLIATGRSVQVCYNYTTSKPIPVTDDLRGAFARIG